MTGQGEDILAWTENAIQERERWATVAAVSGLMDFPEGATWQHRRDDRRGGHMIYRPDATGTRESVAFVFGESAATHIGLNDPEAILRRCAADRKLLALHALTTGHNVYGGTLPACSACGTPEEYPVRFPCPTVRAVAEGYGWTEGER